MDFEFTAIARTSVHLADRQAASQSPPRGTVELSRKLAKRLVVDARGRLGQGTVRQALE
jgi:hypothetical protein